ncbi:hypothetical protein [Paraflavitalea soli]|uniref:hypothetical protein n=1 Tax=Paraflavitalea soli TaxID=2315862 RepID=UPI0013C4AD02|nr:hypothetical protein [Paraflavitalea soli]
MNMLKNVLLINALSSGATGVLLVLFPGLVAGLCGATLTWPFVAAGLFLIVFAALVFVQSRKQVMQKGWIKLIIALDIIWVIESLIIVVPQLFGLSFLGYFLIGAVAGWVALMAFLQSRGLKQYLAAR